jgi:hypothetical protein
LITDYVLTAVFAGLSALLGLIPAWTLPTPASAGVTALGIVSNLARIIPLVAITEAFAALLALQLLLTGWDFVVWVYHQFWGGD